jgi:broad specificity phosphatase PhoE
MKTDPTGDKTLALLHDLIEQGITRYVVLMRHADRPIETVENDLHMQVSEAGKEAAFAFGQKLPTELPIHLYASPVDRCVETAELIGKGFESVGGARSEVSETEALYAFYVKDVHKADGILYEMFGRGEWAQFFRNWFEGVYPESIIGNAAQAAETLMATLLELLQQSESAGSICVSHDINLFLIKEYYLGLQPEDHEYVQFLEGVIVYEKDGSTYIINHQSEARLLTDASSFAGQ